jgi:membrane-associated phospholipid phosphatase
MRDLKARWPLGLCRKNSPNYATLLALTLFILLFFDIWVSRSVQSWAREWREPFAFVTDFGLSEWLLIPSLAVFLLAAVGAWLVPQTAIKRILHELAMVSSFVFAAVGVPGLAANILKRAFGRARPLHYLDSGAFHFQTFVNDWNYQSFPSGHATTAMAAALVVGFLAPTFFRLFFAIAIMAGISRIVVGMHYPTDVVAGFALGGLGAYAVRNFYARRRWLFVQSPDGKVRFRGVPALRKIFRRLSQRALV